MEKTIEVVEGQEQLLPYSFEMSQNSKGYVQLKIKVRQDVFDIARMGEQFEKAFATMAETAIKAGHKIQPSNDPIDQKFWNVVINDLDQQEAEDIETYLKEWAEEEDTPAIQDCIQLIPPKVNRKVSAK